ncbi:MAG: hypothetical protein QF464_20380, partial [Myxococcota bacterium]|nr:hypothetical protein [Myxococcota bacterium]
THTGFADITADLFSEVAHADSVGCNALADTLPDTEAQGELFDGLGADVLTPDCPSPCEDDAALEDGMPTDRQALLSRVVVRAFLDARLREDPAAQAFLNTHLAASEEDVTVEVID